MEYCSLAKRFQKTVGTIRNKLLWNVNRRLWKLLSEQLVSGDDGRSQ